MASLRHCTLYLKIKSPYQPQQLDPSDKPILADQNFSLFEGEAELLAWHRRFIGQDGDFRVNARLKNGEYVNAGTYTVSNECSEIRWRDRRCILYRFLVKREFLSDQDYSL